MARALVALTALVLLLPAAASPRAAVLAISLERGALAPDPEDAYNAAGVRGWDQSFTVTVSGAETCEVARVRYAYSTHFDRRRTGGYSGSFDVSGADSIDVFASSAELIRARAVVTCEDSGETSAAATASARVPPHTCDQGPLPVVALRGRAWREDLERANVLRPLRRGDFVLPVYSFRVGRASRLVLAAPSCGRLLYRFDGPATGVAGDYDRRGRGGSFGLDAGRVRARGNRHAGPVSTPTGLVSPIRTALSVYGIRTTRRHTVVWVLRGAVRVVSLYNRTRIVVRAGFTTSVRCPSIRTCVVDRPRRFR